MQTAELKAVVLTALDDLKAKDVKALDVSEVSSFADVMIVASGGSTRQVKALADKVVDDCKKAGVRPIGLEGEREGEWVLVDLGDVVVHVMLPEMRDFYSLEKLWSMPPSQWQSREA